MMGVYRNLLYGGSSFDMLFVYNSFSLLLCRGSSRQKKLLQLLCFLHTPRRAAWTGVGEVYLVSFSFFSLFFSVLLCMMFLIRIGLPLLGPDRRYLASGRGTEEHREGN